MQWSAESNAGFSDGEPWLPLSADYGTRNVETLRDEPRSILTLYRRLIVLRREHPALSIGAYVGRGVEGNVLWFERHHAATRLIVALNLAREPSALHLPADARLLLSTHLDREGEPVGLDLALRSDEGVVLAL
jgi:alpha-glucosidase